MKFQTHAEAQAAINTLHSSRTLPVSPLPPTPRPQASPAPPGPPPGLAQSGQSIPDRVFEFIWKEFSGRIIQPLRDTFTFQMTSPYLLSPVPVPHPQSKCPHPPLLPPPSLSPLLVSHLFSTFPYPLPSLAGCQHTCLEAPHACCTFILLPPPMSSGSTDSTHGVENKHVNHD